MIRAIFLGQFSEVCHGGPDHRQAGGHKGDADILVLAGEQLREPVLRRRNKGDPYQQWHGEPEGWMGSNHTSEDDGSARKDDSEKPA